MTENPPEYVVVMLKRLEQGDEVMRALRMQMQTLGDELKTVRVSFTAVEAQHKEMVDTYKAFKATIKVFGLIESACVFITKVSLASGSIWAIWKFIIKETFERISK